MEKAVAIKKQLTPEEREQARKERREEARINELFAKSGTRAAARQEVREKFIKGLRISGIPEERIPGILKNCDLEEI